MGYSFDRHLDFLIARAALPSRPAAANLPLLNKEALIAVVQAQGATVVQLFFTPASVRRPASKLRTVEQVVDCVADLKDRSWRSVVDRSLAPLPARAELLAAVLATAQSLGLIDSYEIMREQRYRSSLARSIELLGHTAPALRNALIETKESCEILRLAARRAAETDLPKERRHYSTSENRLLRALLRSPSMWRYNPRGAKVPVWELLVQQFNAATNRALSVEAIRIHCLRNILNAKERASIKRAYAQAGLRRAKTLARNLRIAKRYPDVFDDSCYPSSTPSRREIARLGNALRGIRPVTPKEREALTELVACAAYRRENGMVHWPLIQREMKRRVGYSRSRGSYRQILGQHIPPVTLAAADESQAEPAVP